MNIQPYLCLAGYEILNDMRTLTYLRRGLAGPLWSAGTAAHLLSQAAPYQVVQGDVYSDTYVDSYNGALVTLYHQDVYTPQNLASYCKAIDFSLDQPQSNYVDPKTDNAPWYTSARPESADFLGLSLMTGELESVLTRAVNARTPAGASLGRMFPKQRILAVEAIMFAASEKGMAYGERWLTDVLAGNQCDALTDLGDLVILPGCDYGFRTLRRCGLIDGPLFSELGHDQSVPTCHAQKVTFQVASELPWLYADPTVLASVTVSPGHNLNAAAITSDWVGDAAMRLTVSPTADFTGTLTATPLPAGFTCPTPALSPALSYAITGVPAGDVLVLDGSVRSLLEWLAGLKAWTSGFPRITSTAGPFQWPDVPPCSTVCFSVAATAGSATVELEQINREL